MVNNSVIIDRKPNNDYYAHTVPLILINIVLHECQEKIVLRIEE